MEQRKIKIEQIPTVIWGPPSEKVYLFVHGKMSCKEAAEEFAGIAAEKGYQTVSFDLPAHGERVDEAERCDIWNGMRDLTIAGDYVFSHWKAVSLYACSLGAYFSLNAYPGRALQKCLFQSPVLDMEYLIGQMMLWFDVPEERLAREKEVDTPIDVLSWDYWQYVKTHPVREWRAPTCILYGGRDTLQSRQVVQNFAKRFHCTLTVSEESDHPFMAQTDAPIVRKWLRENIGRPPEIAQRSFSSMMNCEL